jgi:Ca2+-binding RTX toxin-like protein
LIHPLNQQRHDFLFGGAGSDTVHGNLGSDFVSGGSEGDTVRGGGGNDKILGHNGDDFLYGDPGTDELTGGVGSDTFVLGGIYSENLSNAAIADVIKDFTVGVGSIGLAGGLTSDQVLPILSGTDTLFMLGDKILARVVGILPGAFWNYKTGLQD